MGKVIKFKPLFSSLECTDPTHASDYSDKVVLDSVGYAIDKNGYLYIGMADGCYEVNVDDGANHVDNSDWREAADWFGELSPHDWAIVEKHLTTILLRKAQEYRALCTPLIWNT